MELNDVDTRHRANYILEQGVWRATCRTCGYQVTDPIRRRAASVFRSHIREATEKLFDRSVHEGRTPAPIVAQRIV